MQAAFQTCCDNGAVADHTHKFSKRIHFNGRERNAFDVSYTAMALNGKANFSRMTSGKSNDEVQPLVEGYREVRKKAGFEFLKTFVEMEGPIARSGRRYSKNLQLESIRTFQHTWEGILLFWKTTIIFFLLPFKSKG